MRKKRVCKVCGGCENVSKNSGLCSACAIAAVYKAGKELQLKQGPAYEKWKRGILISLGVLEDEPAA